MICALIALCTLALPTSLQCPPRYDLRTGVRRSGEFECWPNVVGNPDYDGTWGRPERGVQPPGIIVLKVWCRASERPVIFEERVRCAK